MDMRLLRLWGRHVYGSTDAPALLRPNFDQRGPANALRLNQISEHCDVEIMIYTMILKTVPFVSSRPWLWHEENFFVNAVYQHLLYMYHATFPVCNPFACTARRTSHGWFLQFSQKSLIPMYLQPSMITTRQRWQMAAKVAESLHRGLNMPNILECCGRHEWSKSSNLRTCATALIGNGTEITLSLGLQGAGRKHNKKTIENYILS